MHDFDAQHVRGQSGEVYLDRFFEERGHTVHRATRGEQLRGIDRVIAKDGQAVFVEYKTDFRAHETGRVFIETVSVDTEGTAGWAYTSEAQYLIYYIPGLKAIYVIPLAALRSVLPVWAAKFQTRPARNEGYATHGVLVPIAVFAEKASQVFEIDST